MHTDNNSKRVCVPRDALVRQTHVMKYSIDNGRKFRRDNHRLARQERKWILVLQVAALPEAVCSEASDRLLRNVLRRHKLGGHAAVAGQVGGREGLPHRSNHKTYSEANLIYIYPTISCLECVSTSARYKWGLIFITRAPRIFCPSRNRKVFFWCFAQNERDKCIL